MRYHYIGNAYDSGEGARVLGNMTEDVGEAVIVDGLEPGEPVFVLRARDPFAIAAMNHYRVVTEGVFTGQKAEDLERAADRMIAWAEGNRPLVRFPD